MPKADYRSAGVDIREGDRLVELIKPLAARTHRPGLLGGIGGFGGLFAIPPGFREPVLVSGTDGVGTKLKVAFAARRHHAVGIDLVAMSVNDVLVTGAEPLFFLDYYATSRLDAEAAAEVVAGIADGCAQAGCALLGGETAELPGFYAEGEYDLAGFAVGIVERSELIDGSKVAPGDVVLGLASNGLHSNGFALVRRVLFDVAGLALEARPPELSGRTLADELLQPTIIYARAVTALRKAAKDQGAGPHHRRRAAWQPAARPPRRNEGAAWNAVLGAAADFDLLARLGEIDPADLFETFNMGIGMCAVVEPEDAAPALAALSAVGQKAWVIGAIEAADGHSEAEVLLTPGRAPFGSKGE